MGSVGKIRVMHDEISRFERGKQHLVAMLIEYKISDLYKEMNFEEKELNGIVVLSGFGIVELEAQNLEADNNSENEDRKNDKKLDAEKQSGLKTVLENMGSVEHEESGNHYVALFSF